MDAPASAARNSGKARAERGRRSRALAPLLITALALAVPATQAHSPHDDVTAIVAGAATADGRPLFVIVRNNLLTSSDDGETWQRLVNGLTYSHRINAVAVSDPVPSTVYVTSTHEGVFRSRDGGRSWKSLSINGEYPPLNLVEVLPGAGDVVLATGEDSGLFASRDGGASWTKTVGSAQISALAVAKHGQAVVVIAATERGRLMISSDGFSWRDVRGALPGDITAIAVSPAFADDKVIALGARRRGVHLARLVDIDDKPRVQVTTVRPASRVQSIAFSPDYAEDRTILASVDDGAIASTDGGETWANSGGGRRTHKQAVDYGVPHFGDVVLSNDYGNDRTAFLAGFNGLFRTVDGGTSWQELPTLSRCILTNVDVSPGFADDQTLAVATYKRGVYISRDGGETWTADRRGMQTEGVGGATYLPRGYEVAFSPNYVDDGTMYLATGRALLKRDGVDREWRPAGLEAYDGWFLTLRKRLNFTAGRGLKPKLAFDPGFDRTGTMYFATPEGDVFASHDAGENFEHIANVGAPVFDLEIVAGSAGENTLFAGSRNATYLSTDSGEDWTKRASGLDVDSGLRDGAVVQIAVSPAFPRDGILFAASRSGLYRSTNGGRRWSRLPLGEASETSPVDAIVVSPNFASDRTVFANVRGVGLLKSEDGGETFVAVASELLRRNISHSPMANFPSSAMPLTFSPDYEQDGIIFGVSERDVLRSVDRGAHWDVLPARPCKDPY